MSCQRLLLLQKVLQIVICAIVYPGILVVRINNFFHMSESLYGRSSSYNLLLYTVDTLTQFVRKTFNYPFIFHLPLRLK
jgi:hypothetical protein